MKRWFMTLLMSMVLHQSAFGISLFHDENYQSLIADHKAFLPGDLLTVLVIETSNAQTGADLSSTKAIKTALAVGYNKKEEEVNFALSGQGAASAKTGRNGKIKASLTVRVLTVLPNQHYQVEGIQVIQINGEKQTIRLRGIVRTEDISPQNTVLSTRLANAHITYSGNGSVSNAEHHNYVYKLLSFVGLV